jgi:hypothetical protein
MRPEHIDLGKYGAVRGVMLVCVMMVEAGFELWKAREILLSLIVELLGVELWALPPLHRRKTRGKRVSLPPCSLYYDAWSAVSKTGERTVRRNPPDRLTQNGRAAHAAPGLIHHAQDLEQGDFAAL